MNNFIENKDNVYAEGHYFGKIIFYILRGVDFVNNFKYVGVFIFGIYVLLKLDNAWWLVLISIIALPILLVLGWVFVHKLAKIIDWLTIQYATFWSRYSFTLQEKQISELEKINEKLDKIK